MYLESVASLSLLLFLLLFIIPSTFLHTRHLCCLLSRIKLKWYFNLSILLIIYSNNILSLFYRLCRSLKLLIFLINNIYAASCIADYCARLVQSMVGGLASLGARSIALIRPCLGLFPSIVTTFLPSIFQTTLLLLFLCLFLPLPSCLLFPCARYILCGILTPCMGSPFPTVHTRCSPCISVLCNVFAATKDPWAS